MGNVKCLDGFGAPKPLTGVVSGHARRRHFVDLVLEVIDGQLDQTAHLVQGLALGVKHLMQNILIRFEFGKVFMREDTMQLVLFNQIPTTFNFHGHLLVRTKVNGPHPTERIF